MRDPWGCCSALESSRPRLKRNRARQWPSVKFTFSQELKARAVPTAGVDRPWVPVNIATINGGSAINIVPDKCTLELGYRPLPGMASEDVFHELSQRLRARCGSTLVETALLRATPSMLTPPNTPLAKILDAHANHSQCETASFATDGGNLASLGTQPLIFGPGSIEVAHQADEYVEAKALLHAVDVIEAVIRKRCC